MFRSASFFVVYNNVVLFGRGGGVVFLDKKFSGYFCLATRSCTAHFVCTLPNVDYSFLFFRILLRFLFFSSFPARATMQHRIINLDAAEGNTSASSHSQGPDFVIIGAQKAGTTALFEDMLVSPRFSFPKFQTENKKSFKEAHFFDHCLGVGTLNTHYYKKPAPDLGYWCDLKLYLDLFKSCGKKTCGDASPSYMIYPEMPLLVCCSIFS